MAARGETGRRGGQDLPLPQRAYDRARHLVEGNLARLTGSEDRPNGAGDASTHVVFNAKTREKRRRERRRKERQEFLGQGGQIREVDPSKEPEVAEAVAALYLQPSAIEHFADVTPFTTDKAIDEYYEAHPLPPSEDKISPTNAKELKNYYKKNPDAKLIVAQIGDEILGAVTVVRTKGLSEAKINRVVAKADRARQGIGHLLVREGIVKSFAEPEQGGFGVNSIVIGYILDIDGSEAPRRLFDEFDFENSMKFKDRCLGWDNKEEQLVYRDVQQMALQKDKALERWRVQIKAGTSLPPHKAA